MSLTAALVGATLVTLAHGATHYLFGDPDSFGVAGVNAAGAAVFVVSFVVLLVVV